MIIHAKYTIVLKTLLDDPLSKEAIDEALSDYPLITPKNEFVHSMIPTRAEINKKLLDHYKYREIAFETFGRFLDELKISMNEIMPKYNQLMNSEDIINGLEDIFGNLDVVETYDEERSGTSQDNTEGSESIKDTSSQQATSETSDTSTINAEINDSSKQVKSDTPQSQLDIPASNIDNIEYANEVNWNKNTSNSETTNTGSSENTSNITKEEDSSKTHTLQNTGSTSGTTSHTLTRKGNQGVNTYAHDMLEFRELFINIIQQIITDPRIEELFFTIY